MKWNARENVNKCALQRFSAYGKSGTNNFRQWLSLFQNCNYVYESLRSEISDSENLYQGICIYLYKYISMVILHDVLFHSLYKRYMLYPNGSHEKVHRTKLLYQMLLLSRLSAYTLSNYNQWLYICKCSFWLQFLRKLHCVCVLFMNLLFLNCLYECCSFIWPMLHSFIYEYVFFLNSLSAFNNCLNATLICRCQISTILNQVKVHS